MITNIEHYKKQAAEAAVEYIEPGMVIGLGVGSTAIYALKKIAEMFNSGNLNNVRAIPCSISIASEAKKSGIPLSSLEKDPVVDITIDGADEIDGSLNMIKGGGGALLREKVVASVSNEVLTIVDSSKLVECLGKFPLPVEVIPFGWQVVAEKISTLGGKVVLREKI